MKTPIESIRQCLKLAPLHCVFLSALASSTWSEATQVGGIAREFTVTNRETGEPIRMSDYAGKVLVLDFFAYWCAPCQESTPDLEDNVQRYYASRGGNANGVPVECLAISVDDSNPDATDRFVENAGLEISGEDPLTQAGAWRQFNQTDGIPLFVVINCVAGSTSHAQWEVLHNSTGYPGSPALRNIIDRVMPAEEPQEQEIEVDGPDGSGLTDNGPGADLGSVNLGESGNEETFTIRNVGNEPLIGIGVSIDGANADDFVLNSRNTAESLEGGATTTFSITFTPTASGTRNATIRIASNDSDENPFDIAVSGDSVSAPELEVRSGASVLSNGDAVSFGFSIIGQEGPQRTILISNVGNAPLEGVTANLVGARSADFSVLTAPDVSIPPGESTPVIIQFRPTSTGASNATLRISSNDGDEGSFDIELSGSGSGSDANLPILQVVDGDTPLEYGASVIDFGTVAVGRNSPKRTIRIGNLGNAPLSRIFASLGGEHSSDFQIDGQLMSDLAPSANSSVTISFRPSGSGSRSATLRIISSDANQNPFDIKITGTGEKKTKEPEITLTKGGRNAKALKSGKSSNNLGSSRVSKKGKRMTFTITNSGNRTLKKIRLKLTGKHRKDFILVRKPAKKSLAPGAEASFQVALLPKKTGKRKAVLRILSNSKAQSPFVVKLTGTGKGR